MDISFQKLSGLAFGDGFRDRLFVKLFRLPLAVGRFDNLVVFVLVRFNDGVSYIAEGQSYTRAALDKTNPPFKIKAKK